jgi:hypothetical protein
MGGIVCQLSKRESGPSVNKKIVASHLAKGEKYPAVKRPFLLILPGIFGIIFRKFSHSSPHPSGEKWLFSQGDRKLLYLPRLESEKSRISLRLPINLAALLSTSPRI